MATVKQINPHSPLPTLSLHDILSVYSLSCRSTFVGINQKEAVAALHRERMLTAAEELFQQKGFEATTIDDISKASGYSRRTLYAYFVNKEDFLWQIVRKGLEQLDGALEAALRRETFEECYFAACEAVLRYLRDCPQSAKQVRQVQPEKLDGGDRTVREILTLGQQINGRLSEMIRQGQKEGSVRETLHPERCVVVLWSALSGWNDTLQNQGAFLAERFHLSQSEFQQEALEQLLFSLRKEKTPER